MDGSRKGCANTDIGLGGYVQRPFRPIAVVSRSRFRVRWIYNGLNPSKKFQTRSGRQPGGLDRGARGVPPKRSKPGSREFFSCDSLRKFEKKVVFKCITGINGSYPDDGTHFVFVFTRLGNVLVKLYKEPRRAVPPT